MSQFPMKSPTRILQTMEDTREVINNAEWIETNKLHELKTVKSIWIITLINEVKASGQYPYNATIKKLARERLGLLALSDKENSQEGDALSWLIYTAQRYHESDNLQVEGYVPFTKELLQEIKEGGQISLPVKNLFTIVLNGEVQDSQPSVYNVRNVKGVLYAMKPRVRKSALSPNGQPVKIIAYGKEQKKLTTTYDTQS
jgi:hypothetical protein